MPNTSTPPAPAADEPKVLSTAPKAEETTNTFSGTTDAAPTPATPAPVTPAAPAVTTTATVAPTVAQEDADAVATDPNADVLKGYLSSFLAAISRPGSNPSDFKKAAGFAEQITNHVIRYPTVPVLSTLLAFFEDNVTKIPSFMKGATTLTAITQSRVGYLFSLFSDLAMKVHVQVSNSEIVNVLGKQEIAGFYHRIQMRNQQSDEASAS